jgi:hypothetical protein
MDKCLENQCLLDMLQSPFVIDSVLTSVRHEEHQKFVLRSGFTSTSGPPTTTSFFSSSLTIILNALQLHLLFGTLEKRIEVEREVEREVAREVKREVERGRERDQERGQETGQANQADQADQVDQANQADQANKPSEIRDHRLDFPTIPLSSAHRQFCRINTTRGTVSECPYFPACCQPHQGSNHQD